MEQAREEDSMEKIENIEDIQREANKICEMLAEEQQGQVNINRRLNVIAEEKL